MSSSGGVKKYPAAVLLGTFFQQFSIWTLHGDERLNSYHAECRLQWNTSYCGNGERESRRGRRDSVNMGERVRRRLPIGYRGHGEVAECFTEEHEAAEVARGHGFSKGISDVT